MAIAFSASGCTFAWRGCLKGVERAAGGPVLRDRRSALEMARKFRGGRSISFIWVAWAAFGSCLKGLDVVGRAAGGPVLGRSNSCMWVYVCVAWAAFGSCLKGLDVVERAAGGPVLRDRRSTLEMTCRFRGGRSLSCIWVYVCVAWAAFGSCLKGLDVVERALTLTHTLSHSLTLTHTHSHSLTLTHSH